MTSVSCRSSLCRGTWRRLCVPGVLLWLAWAPARALEVGETLWNFDGHLVPERFNLLSVQLKNPAAEAFEGEVRLEQVSGVGAIAGVPCVQSCYVTPFGSRWLQFEVFVDGQNGIAPAWQLAWAGRQGKRVRLPEARLGAPGRVLLTDADAWGAARIGFRRFPEQLFPASIAALDGLQSVLLDHVPRWEAARRAVFLDWVRGGGSVHLLLDAQGRAPVFADELAVLNGHADEQRLGAGWIFRHGRGAQAIDEVVLAVKDLRAPELSDNTTNTVLYQVSGSLLRPLSRMAQPEYCWWLIGLLALFYVTAVGPGVFLLGWKVRDYRLSLLAMVGCVVVFGLLFSIVGRRGQGEKGRIDSLAYARALGGGEYLATQWTHLFVTRGAFYTMTHPGRHHLYAVPADAEQVNGVVVCGRDSLFHVDIPLFSQRGFLHQGKVTGPSFEVRAETWPRGRELGNAGLTVQGDVPNVLAAWGVWRERVQPLRLSHGRLESAGPAATFDTFFSRETLDPWDNLGHGAPASRETLEAVAQRKAATLMAWGLGSTKALKFAVDDPLEQRRLRVFLLAAAPAGFRPHDQPRIGAANGYVLYACDVIPPAGHQEER